MKLGLEGRRALVTGGSKGLGAAIARELVGEGVRVAICSRNEEESWPPARNLASSTHSGPTSPIPSRSRISSGAPPRSSVGSTPRQQRRRRAPRHIRHADGRELDRRPRREALLVDPLLPRGAPVHARGGRRPHRQHRRRLLALPRPHVLCDLRQPGSRQLVHEDPGAGGGEGQDPRKRRQHRLRHHPQWDNIHQRRAPELPREEFFDQFAAQEFRSAASVLRTRSPASSRSCSASRASYITGASIDVAGGMGKYVSRLVGERTVAQDEHASLGRLAIWGGPVKARLVWPMTAR